MKELKIRPNNLMKKSATVEKKTAQYAIKKLMRDVIKIKE
jgi:hypothetical protein